MYMAGRITLPAAASRFRRGGAVSAAGWESVERIANAHREQTRRAGRVERRVAQRVAALCVGRERLRNETTGGVEAGRAELGGGRVMPVEHVGDAREEGEGGSGLHGGAEIDDSVTRRAPGAQIENAVGGVEAVLV